MTYTDLVYVPERYVKENQLLVEGDVVIAASSGSRSVVGKAGQALGSWRGAFGAFCFLLRPSTEADLRYFGLFFQTEDYRSQVSEVALGVNINNLRQEHVNELAFPLPPLAEQRRIAAEVERRLSVLQQAEAAVQDSLARADRLRQSILARAFSGELVPQNPNDEPAAALLERIKAERAAKEEAARAERRARRKPRGTARRKAGGIA